MTITVEQVIATLEEVVAEDSEMDGRPPVLEDWDAKSIEVLAAAQRVQDTQKCTWGRALTAAKAAL